MPELPSQLLRRLLEVAIIGLGTFAAGVFLNYIGRTQVQVFAIAVAFATIWVFLRYRRL